MSVLKVLTAGDPILRQTSEMIPKMDKRITKLLKNMVDTLYAGVGVGLAAPQVGILKRIVVIDTEEGFLLKMINPVITRTKGSAVRFEGCLSVPQYDGYVERAEEIDCEFIDHHGQRMRLTCDGLLANVVQHELDHLDGILFVDKAQSIEPKLVDTMDDNLKTTLCVLKKI